MIHVVRSHEAMLGSLRILAGADATRGHYFAFESETVPAEVPGAVRRLRPQASMPMRERTPLTAWPEVPAEYILCTEDRAVSPAWSRDVARRRLGITPQWRPPGWCATAPVSSGPCT